MLEVITSEIPEWWQPEKGEVKTESKIKVKKRYNSLIPPHIVPFYQQAGQIEGLFESLATAWCDGGLVLEILKERFLFNGTLVTYEEDTVVQKTVDQIKFLAEYTSRAFEATSYSLQFHFHHTCKFIDPRT